MFLLLPVYKGACYSVQWRELFQRNRPRYVLKHCDFSPLSSKTICCMVSTCFSLGLLSSCPVCERWWHLQWLQGNCPGCLPQWGPGPSGYHLAGHLLGHWKGVGCSNMPTEKTLHCALRGENTFHFHPCKRRAVRVTQRGGLSIVAVTLLNFQAWAPLTMCLECTYENMSSVARLSGFPSQLRHFTFGQLA